jgi:hypothetical protein
VIRDVDVQVGEAAVAVQEFDAVVLVANLDDVHAERHAAVVVEDLSEISPVSRKWRRPVGRGVTVAFMSRYDYRLVVELCNILRHA